MTGRVFGFLAGFFFALGNPAFLCAGSVAALFLFAAVLLAITGAFFASGLAVVAAVSAFTVTLIYHLHEKQNRPRR